MLKPTLAASTIGSLFLIAATTQALAQSPDAIEQQQPALDASVDDEAGDWDGAIGLGVGVLPTYQGSGETLAAVVPILRLSWRDRIEIGSGGLSWLISNDGPVRWGVGLTFDRGRDEEDGQGFFIDDLDGRLLGMGDVDSAVGLRVFGSTHLGPVELHASVSKFSGDGDDELVPQNDGVLAEFGATMPILQRDRWKLAAKLNTTWADEAYTQAFFGVTPFQASQTSFPTFTPGAGLKDVSLGLHSEWSLSSRWFLSADAGVTRLLGDAADSPITEEQTGVSFLVGVGYRF